MEIKLLEELHLLNPWLLHPRHQIVDPSKFIHRVQLDQLLEVEWDDLWTILIGPRRAGKTTLGTLLAHKLIQEKRFKQLLYLNCDFLSIRKWLTSPAFIAEAIKELSLTAPILFIDEVQRLENPGLLLKAIIDLKLPIKLIATGSSQLEIRSKVQEHLTGRQLTSLVLPLSTEEIDGDKNIEELVVYGTYPQALSSSKKEIQLGEIYERYIQKDIIEILKVGKPDVLQQLLALIAHSSGQLVDYNQLATDCQVSVTMIRNHLDILEQTFVLAKITPFVGNKRTEITSNPIYYFLDNGFRNTALRNFSDIETRTDRGLLIESFVFQEILKFQTQHFLPFDIHYWRTKSGAEVDFVLFKNDAQFLPVEVKYQRMTRPAISRGYRSFIEAYQPKDAVIITKDLIALLKVNTTNVHFIPLQQIDKLRKLISSTLYNIS